MIPIFQTRYGVPFGNCFGACVASILEVGIDDVWDSSVVPIGEGRNCEWWDGWRTWLNAHGYDLVACRADAWFFPPKGYSIAGGKAAATDTWAPHAVVVFDGKLVHDPHEGWNGLSEVEDYCVIFPVAQYHKETNS